MVNDLTNTIDRLQVIAKFGIGCEAICYICK